MRMKITRHNKCFITWGTIILNEAHCPYCGVASCGAPGSFHAHMIFLILVEMSFNRHTCCGVEVVNGWMAIFISISAVISKKIISVTAHTSICNTESSDLVNNLSVKKKNLPEDALDRNVTQFNIKTAMHSGSEHGTTGPVVLSF